MVCFTFSHVSVVVKSFVLDLETAFRRQKSSEIVACGSTGHQAEKRTKSTKVRIQSGVRGIVALHLLAKSTVGSKYSQSCSTACLCRSRKCSQESSIISLHVVLQHGKSKTRRPRATGRAKAMGCFSRSGDSVAVVGRQGVWSRAAGRLPVYSHYGLH